MCVPLYYFAAKPESRHAHNGRATGGSFPEYTIHETRRAHDKSTYGFSAARVRAPKSSTRASRPGLTGGFRKLQVETIVGDL